MTGIGFVQVLLYLAVLIALIIPLGSFMAKVFEKRPCFLDPVLKPIEKRIYRLCSIKPEEEMSWKEYLAALLFLNLFGFLALYLIQRLQAYLPLNPEGFANLSPDLAFNTATSFVTNTNWQNYGGESTLSYLSQMLGLTVQNFLSAASGICILIALIRSLIRQESNNLGNFWVDLVRSILYILLPLSLVFALFLSSQGVIQNLKPYQTINLLQPLKQEAPKAAPITQIKVPMGPAASQIAIKQLGTNGGGFFNTNSAHPFENPTPLTNFFEMLAILLLPAALCYTFGLMIKDRRQGWAIFIAMLLIFLPFMASTIVWEQQGNPAFNSLSIDQIAQPGLSPGGNMEGKELRFGITNSALWAAATTATSNGSVNSMHDSFTPLGGLVPLWLMHLGEVVFGGIGSGLYGMLMLVIITVFVAGLMVGRTPEYLGKKIEPYEMKMAAFAVLLMPLIVLFLTALACVTPEGISSISNPGAHGYSEILYAFTSMGNNNGSAFAGLNGNTLFYNGLGGLEMLFCRYWIMIPILALAGALVKKKTIPSTAGTLQTHTALFVILLICITLILGALTFFPALALGPVVEQLMLWRSYGH